jgi:hypothetical protein
MTAAEIAAAEAAAAQILAAQQAAAVAQAAQVAQATQAAQAAQAATTATQAATQAGTQAAAQAGTQAATQASTSGIQALAQEVGAAVQPTGLETLTTQAELEQMRQAASGAQNLAQAPVQATTPMANPSMSQAQYDFLHNSYAGPADPVVDMGNFPGSAGNPLSPITAETIPASQSVPLTTVAPPAAPTPAPALAPAPAPAAPPVEVSGVSPSTDPSLGGVGTGYQGNAIQIGSASNATPYTSAELQLMHGQSQGSGLQGLLDKGIAYAEKHPIQTGLGAMSLYNMLNRPKPYEKPKYKSTFNAGAYRGYEPTPPTPYTPQYAQYAQGGLADLGGYSDYARGGRMLKGPGDGMSDDIPATIANKQPARLANEEFVVPADVVSHLGNGSSEAGAKALYKMMDRVRQARTGNKKQGKQINPEKYLA